MDTKDWLPFESDEDGYPDETWLEHFRGRGYCPGSAARFLVKGLPPIAEQISCMRVDLSRLPDDDLYAPGWEVRFVTGGWSGAEDLIEAMLDHLWIAHFHSKWERGGAFWFKVPDVNVEQPDNPAAAFPRGPSPTTGGAP